MIHTDFERGFIRSETITYDDYIAYGGEAGAAAARKNRPKRKKYIFSHGDLMHFRVSTLASFFLFGVGALARLATTRQCQNCTLQRVPSGARLASPVARTLCTTVTPIWSM